MNYLAHFYFTQGLEEITAGNFIADFVRSSQHHQFSNGVLNGIEIHRSIDSFTDEHPVVKKSKQRLYEKYHKYSTVIVDVLYDHLLALNWSKFSKMPLAQFTHETYSLLRKQQHVFPAEAQRMFHFMSAYDWLYSYQTVEGIQRALTGLSRRARFKSGMEKATEDLKESYADFEKEFTEFFPELSEEIKRLL
jgi:acyl carrier protein phosphodiesterase